MLLIIPKNKFLYLNIKLEIIYIYYTIELSLIKANINRIYLL